MPRKTFLIRRIKAQTPANDTAGKYLFDWRTKDLHYAPESFPRLTSEQLFGNSLPLEMEVGCSTGEFLTSLAREDKEANFLGVDINLKSLFMAVETASGLALDNIKFIKAPIQQLYPLLDPASLRAIYLHFPDPYLRPKYRKHRIFSQLFLDYAHKALVPGGLLSVVTDHQALFMLALSIMERDTRFVRLHEERYLIGFDPEVKSRYQRYWESHGASIFRLEVEKTGG